MLRLVVMVLCIGGLGALSRPPPRTSPALQTGPLLPRPEFLHAVGASEQQLMADYFWLGMLQQIGVAAGKDGYRDIYPFAEVATDLDPRFDIVYRIAAVSLPYNTFEKGREDFWNTEESTAIIRKGLKAFPRDYQLRFLLANNLMYYHHRYVEAAQVVQSLAEEPRAPKYLAGLATRLYAQSGRFEASVALAEALRDSAPDDDTRAYFARRILEIQQEQVLQTVDAAAKKFLEAKGHATTRVEDLVSSGFLPAIPVDPLGGTLGFNRAGEAISSESDKRLRLHQLNHQVNDPPKPGEIQP